MQSFTRLAAAILLGLAVAGSAFAAAPHAGSEPAGSAPAGDKALNALYWQGQEALKKSDWNAALKRFVELERGLREKEPASADAAVYWQAYALAQAKRTTEAKSTVERLHRDFPDSRWGKEADTLVRQTQAPATAEVKSGGDEDIAETAVEGLLNAPPARAVPLLKKVLASQHSTKVKKRALFVLSQIDQADALDSVLDVARNNADPELRTEAIRMLGVSGDKHAVDRLRELYAANATPEVKHTIVQAWLTADRKDLILATARDEADPAVRREAIQALGAMNGSAELRQLLDATHDAANQRAIVQALGVAGDVDALGGIALGNQPEEVRAEAIQALGVAGDAGGAKRLVAIYPKLTAPKLREAALQGLIIAGDGDALVTLYRAASSKEEKKALLRAISIEGGDAALNVIEAELDKK